MSSSHCDWQLQVSHDCGFLNDYVDMSPMTAWRCHCLHLPVDLYVLWGISPWLPRISSLSSILIYRNEICEIYLWVDSIYILRIVSRSTRPDFRSHTASSFLSSVYLLREGLHLCIYIYCYVCCLNDQRIRLDVTAARCLPWSMYTLSPASIYIATL